MIHKDYIRLNRIIAGVILLISFIVYFATMAPTVSYWDCGEFIATSYTLGVPHPPGSPLYLILGRIISMIPFNGDVGYRVNLMSPIVSAVAVMLLYLIIVKFITQWRGPVKDRKDVLVAFGGALIGSLTFAFTDSHWFNAVEAEVYAMSTFFTAIVVWLILLWNEREDKPGSERYILIIAYMLGLATGVHMLNLLTLPFIALVIYFRKLKFGWKTFFLTVLITGVTFIIIHNGIIKGLPKLARGFGLAGVTFVVLLVAGGMVWAIANKKRMLSVAMTSAVLILIGYSSYALIFIRSQKDPGIDENDPETVAAAISYLEREQYGSVGQLPRRYDGLPPQHEVVGRPANGNKYSAQQNRRYMTYNLGKQWDFFWSYQVKKMYWRYFLWQFAGRGPAGSPGVTAMGANPPTHPTPQDGVDWFQFGLPLAFLLGLGGMVYHFNRDGEKAFLVATLFLMTGLAIIVYLNQDNPQPRERDYSYVGSFLAFSIWIGIGSAALHEWLIKRFGSNPGRKVTVAAIVAQLFLIPGVMLKANYHTHDRSGNFVAWDYSYNLLQSCEPNGVLFTNGDNDTFPLWYLQEVEGVRRDVTVANLSLLNTPWYIRQLRDVRPDSTRFVKLTDEQIDRLTAGLQRWSTREVTFPVKSDKQITWTVKPTYAKVALKVQDLMIMQIINDANWRVPIYFAVTVSPSNRIGLEKYLEMEGLAYRLRSYPTKSINPERMTAHLMTDIGAETWAQPFGGWDWQKAEGKYWFRDYNDKYLFRHLGNPEVYYNPQIVRLLQNYRSAYMQLAVHNFLEYQRLSRNPGVDSVRIDQIKQQVVDVLDEMATNIPEETIPMESKELYYQLGRLQYGLGNPEKLREVLDALLERHDLTLRDRISYGQSYLMELQDFEKGKDIFEGLYRIYQELKTRIQTGGAQNSGISQKAWSEWMKVYPEIVSHLVLAYKKLDLPAEAEAVLTSWLEENPNDQEAKRMLEEIRQQNNL